MLGFIKLGALGAALSFSVVAAIDHEWPDAGSRTKKIYTDRVAPASADPLPGSAQATWRAGPVVTVERAGKADRIADIAPADCRGQSWPYLAAECLTRDDGRPRPSRIRMITIEQRQGAVSILQRVRDVEVAHR
jgi:hypothetical protein